MNIFKKKPTIEFFSLIPEVAMLAPLVSAKKFRPEVLLNASKQYADEKQKDSYGFEELVSTAKCPGIYDYARYGWVLVAWQDFTIETNGDGQSFIWTSPIDQTKSTNGELVGPMISSHSPEQYAYFVGGIPNALQCVVKVQTPWRCVIPEGYYLQEGPIPYTNERRFTTVVGFFDRAHGVAQMNIQLLWHVMEGKTLIKAGTPLAHYMLVPKDQHEMSCNAATDEQILLHKATIAETNRRYVRDHKKRKCIFAEIFK
jgi:hypothetical protein